MGKGAEMRIMAQLEMMQANIENLTKKLELIGTQESHASGGACSAGACANASSSQNQDQDQDQKAVEQAAEPPPDKLTHKTKGSA